ncbi:serine hydrolase [Micromonospora sp. CPCC 205371]|nr:serine hydrolase [Micromonospora sp. CPCC 205371]
MFVRGLAASIASAAWVALPAPPPARAPPTPPAPPAKGPFPAAQGVAPRAEGAAARAGEWSAAVQASERAAAQGAELTAALAAPRAESAAAPPARGATTPAFVPCPAVKPDPPVKRPAKPGAPELTEYQRAVGGDGLATAGLTIPQGAGAPPKLTATSWLVADMDSGEVLGGCGPHEYGTPASVQKLLLAATVMSKLDPKQVIQVNRADLDFEAGSSAVGLLLGGKYSIETLWLGLLLNSGNDAANVLARLGGGQGGVPATIEAMNAEARRLGALQTHAVTPSGLDGEGQFTSAYDLALIARACFANESFRKYVATKQAQIPAQPPKDPRGFQIQNENQLLLRYPGALGGKTGFTTLARHTFVGAAERNGRRLVVTLLGAEARPQRTWQQAAALLDWGYALPAGASVGRLVNPDEVPPSPTPPAAAEGQQPAGGGAPAAGPLPRTSYGPPSGSGIGAPAMVATMIVAARWRRANIRTRRTALEARRAAAARGRGGRGGWEGQGGWDGRR